MPDMGSYFNIYRAADKADRNRVQRRFWLIELLRSLALILMASLLLDLLIVLFLPQGLELLQNTYRREIGYLSLQVDEITAATISSWVNSAYDWVFIRSGIQGFIQNHGGSISGQLITLSWPALQGIMIGFQIFCIRLMVIVLMLPLLLLMLMVAASDGYLLWYRRRTSGGRESSFIYHRAKRLLSGSLFLFWFIYLVFPFAINPAWIFVPSMLLLAAFTRLTIQYFKKYV